MGIYLGETILNPLKEVHRKRHTNFIDPNDENFKNDVNRFNLGNIVDSV